jgi:hypothetical protein
MVKRLAITYAIGSTKAKFFSVRNKQARQTGHVVIVPDVHYSRPPFLVIDRAYAC